MLAVDQEGLPAEHRDEADAVTPEPDHRGARAVDQPPGHVFVGLVPCDLHQGLVKDITVVHRQDDLRAFGLGQVGQDVLRNVVDPRMAEAEAAGGEIGVAALLLFRGLFENQDVGAVLARRHRRAQRRVAGADDNDIVVGHWDAPSDGPDGPAGSLDASCSARAIVKGNSNIFIIDYST